MRLRGGGDDAEEGSQGLGYDDEEAGAATQTFGDDDDDDNAVLTRLHDGQAAGVAATLPDGVLCDVLAIGRDAQAAARLACAHCCSATDGRKARRLSRACKPRSFAGRAA